MVRKLSSFNIDKCAMEASMKRIIAALFFSAILLTLSSSVFAKESVTYQTTSVKFSGGTRSVNAVYVDLNDKSIRMESKVAKNTIGATDDLKNIALEASDIDTEVLAAINGTFFNSYTDMKPWGTIEAEGDFYRLGSSGSVIGFTTDNKPIIETLRVSIKGSINECWEYPSSWYAWNFNVLDSDPKSIIILNSAFGKTSGKHQKTSIVVDNRKVISIKKGEVTIPVNGYVIVAQDSDIIKKFKVGDSVDYKYETNKLDTSNKTTNVDWSNVRTTVGAGPTLLKSGVIVANGKSEGFTEDKINKNRSQRSFAGYTKNNTLILATVPNATILELAEVAKNMGCIDAINLDGGASSGLYYKGKVVSSPGRKLSNALVVTKLKSTPSRLVLNGKEFISQNEPYINTTTKQVMVPVIDICNKFYAHYSIGKTSIVIDKYTTKVAMTLGDTKYLVNGKSAQAVSPPVIKNGVAYIPLQVLSDLYDGKITYDSKANVFSAKINIVNITELVAEANQAKLGNNLEKAIELNLKVIELDPNNKMCHYKLGGLYASIKSNESSIYHYKEFLKFEPQNTEVIGSIAWRYSSLKDMTNTIAYFKKSLEIKKENPGHWIALAQCYQIWSLKQYHDAIECYETALKYQPTATQTAEIKKGILQCKNSLENMK